MHATLKIYLITALLLLSACSVTLDPDYGETGDDTCPVSAAEECDDPVEEPAACPQDAKKCWDGSFVSRVGPDCEFAPCREDPRVFCTDEQRYADSCIEIYQPVCGYFDSSKVQCVRAPCASTVSNSCFACQNSDVEYYVPGPCPS